MMLKYLAFFLIYFLLSQSLYAQVVIKDEIKLDGTEEPSLIFNIPDGCPPGQVFFSWHTAGLRYTKIHPSIYPYSFLIFFEDHNGLKQDEFSYQWEDCYFYGTDYRQENDYIPNYVGDCVGGELKGILYNCDPSHNPIFVPLIYEPFYYNGKLYYHIIHGFENNTIGTIWYQPAQCGSVSLCNQPFTPPGLNISQISNPNICNDISDPIAGAFKGLYWQLRQGEHFELTECQDQMTSEIKFIYGTNLSQTIDCAYSLELCPDKIAYLNLRRIDDMASFESYLSEIRYTITLEQACTIRQWIIGHRGIDDNENQTDGEFLYPDGIWLTAHSLAHEEEHKRDYENELRLAKVEFDRHQKSYSVPCSTYQTNPEQAESWYRVELTTFSDSARSEYDNKLNEVQVNGRPDVLASIEPYLKRFDKFCRDKWGDKTYWDTIKIYCN